MNLKKIILSIAMTALAFVVNPVIVNADTYEDVIENVPKGTYEIEIPLVSIENELVACIIDSQGNAITKSHSYVRDMQAPQIDKLVLGDNNIIMTATDTSGNQTELEITVSMVEEEQTPIAAYLFIGMIVFLFVLMVILVITRLKGSGNKPSNPNPPKKKDMPELVSKSKEDRHKELIAKLEASANKATVPDVTEEDDEYLEDSVEDVEFDEEVEVTPVIPITKTKDKTVKVTDAVNAGRKFVSPVPALTKKKKIKTAEKEESAQGCKMRNIRTLSTLVRYTLQAGCVIVFFTIVARNTVIASGSMEPTLKTGNFALYNKLAYDFVEVQRGDIVAFWSEEESAYLAKRVIGIGGDVIEFHDGYVFINGLLADESAYLDETIETNCTKTFTVPEGCVFVLGDNRENSYDSRYFQMPYIAEDKIEGKYIGSIPKLW